MSEQQTNKAESNPNLPQYMAEEIDRNPNGPLAQAYKQSNGNLHDLLQIADRQGLIAQLPASMQGMVQEYQRDQQKARRDEEDFQRRMAAALAGSVFAMGEARNAEASQPQVERSSYYAGSGFVSDKNYSEMTRDERYGYFSKMETITASDLEKMSPQDRQKLMDSLKDAAAEQVAKSGESIAQYKANALTDIRFGDTPAERQKMLALVDKKTDIKLSNQEFEDGIKDLPPDQRALMREMRDLKRTEYYAQKTDEERKLAEDCLKKGDFAGAAKHTKEAADYQKTSIEKNLSQAAAIDEELDTIKCTKLSPEKAIAWEKAMNERAEKAREMAREQLKDLKDTGLLSKDDISKYTQELNVKNESAVSNNATVRISADTTQAKADVKTALTEGEADFGTAAPAVAAATPAQPVAAARAPSINVGDPPKIGPNSSLLAQLGAPEEVAPADPAVQMQRKAPSAGMGASA